MIARSAERNVSRHVPIEHGSRKLRFVAVDSYNIELRDGESFLGDRANKRAFQAMVDDWRRRLRRDGGDPLKHRPTEELYKDKKELERILVSGDPEAAGVLIGSIEQFAGELAAVIARLLETPEWRDAQCIAIGGGFREGRVGEVVIGRASVLMRANGLSIGLVPLRHHPEQAGLLGGVHLAPEEVLRKYQGILAVDIGGTNVRTGIVEPDIDADGSILDARVHSYELWRHADRKPDKQELLDHMLARLRHIAEAAAREGFAVAPFVAIGCPGLFRRDGTILRGSQNLPGNWDGFNLADYVATELPRVREGLTCVVTHNDAVVQGLSEWPRMRRLKHWGVLTIGTGLGNARFTNR
jgi:predicted NBD/HSP70 family sugar kinase